MMISILFWRDINNMNIIAIVLLGLLYFVLLINRILYLRKIYLLDLCNLKQQGKPEVAGTRTKMIRDGTMRYASQTAEGIVNEAERVAKERIVRRKSKYRRDLINSLVTAITNILKK